MSNEQAPPSRLSIDVDIKGGNVTPTNQQLQAGVKEQIIIRVNSDAADELHVHSTPEHKEWVKKLSDVLKANSIHTILDQENLRLGQLIDEFQKDGIGRADRVLVICPKRTSTRQMKIRILAWGRNDSL